MNAHIQSLETQIGTLQKELSEARRAAQPVPVEEYRLMNPDGSEVLLSALFGEHKDLLVIHNMGKHCRYCTLWADGFVSLAAHLESRTAFVLCSADAPNDLRDFAASRNWPFRTVSGVHSDFAHDMGFASPKGDPQPGVSAFHRTPDGTITRTGYAYFGPGDAFCSVWPFFDLLANGADGWEPQ